MASMLDWKQREIENALTDVGLSPMDKVRQVGDPDGIDLLAREKDVEDRIHSVRLFGGDMNGDNAAAEVLVRHLTEPGIEVD